MRALVLITFIIGSTFAATIPPQIDSNVIETSATPISDTFDVIYNQARSAVVGLYNLLTIPFSILANSQSMMSNNGRVDPFQGITQVTNRALQRASNLLTNNVQDHNSDPLLRIFQQVIGKRMDEAGNGTGVSNMQTLPFLQHLLSFNDRVSMK